MEILIATISLAAGLLFGVLGAWSLAASRRGTESEARVRAETEAASARDSADSLKRELDLARDELTIARTDLATAIEAKRQTEGRFEEQRKLLDDARLKLHESFDALAADALKSNSESFLQMAGLRLQPIQDSFEKLTEHVGSIERARNQAYGALSQQVEQLRGEASNLARALHAPSARGRWGEIQLRRVVELAGMIDHCDFYEQETRENDGVRARPDMRIQLPGGRNIMVDAKTPLNAFLESLETTDEPMRLAKLREHARRVSAHMSELSAKAYWEHLQPAPEFVVMFLPGETFFSAALEQDPTLIEQGVERRVIIATPTTLIALLRSVAYGWRQEQLAENAQKISERGRELYERLGTMANHLGELGAALDRAVRKFNDAIGAMESRVMVSARSLSQLGVASKAEIAELQQIERQPRSVANGDPNV